MSVARIYIITAVIAAKTGAPSLTENSDKGRKLVKIL